jgi:hypothetical protein
MYCPKCDKENPDDVQLCYSCSWVLTEASVTGENRNVRTSTMAIASLILGILSIVTFAITALPAALLGIISRLKIEKSGGRITGEGFAIVGIVVSVVIFFVAGISMPALVRVRQRYFRMVCGRNLSGLGKAMLIYANDYEDELPQAGGSYGAVWHDSLPNWQGINRSQAYGLNANRTGGRVTVASSLYLLVKYTEVAPKTFVCPGDPGVMDFRFSEYDVWNKEYIDVWDFGPNPAEHCSYSYHSAYNSYYALNVASSRPDMAVAADRNPWIDCPAAKAKDFSLFDWDGDTQKQKAGNAIAHLEYGQNVLFLDSHVAFEKRAFCGFKDDNIYTFCAKNGVIQQGSPPAVGKSQPQTKGDSLLVHDDDGLERQRK